MRKIIVAVTALVAALPAPEAHTSEFREEVPLARVVSQSDVIIVAVKADPWLRRVEIPVPPAEGQPAVPPFVHHVSRWIVHEVLWPDAKALAEQTPTMFEGPDGSWVAQRPPKVGDLIEVEGADVSTRREVYQREAADGTRKIPIYSHYEQSFPARLADRGRTIVFLRLSQGRIVDVAGGAQEGLAARAKVLQLLKKTAKP
jgi:hypothetical protein